MPAKNRQAKKENKKTTLYAIATAMPTKKNKKKHLVATVQYSISCILP